MEAKALSFTHCFVCVRSRPDQTLWPKDRKTFREVGGHPISRQIVPPVGGMWCRSKPKRQIMMRWLIIVVLTVVVAVLVVLVDRLPTSRWRHPLVSLDQGRAQVIF